MIHPLRHRPIRRLLPLVALALLALPVGGCKNKGAKAFNQGQAHLNQKRYPKAIQSFEKAIRQNPAFGEAHYNLGAARFQLAVIQLQGLAASHGSPALKAALKAAGGKPDKPHQLTPERDAALARLIRELRQLPAARADAIVALLKKALQAKLKARTLFKKGKFVVIRKSSTRQAMLGKLDQVARLRGLLRERGETDRGLWLAAIARPALLTAQAMKTPSARARPRPTPRPAGAMTP